MPTDILRTLLSIFEEVGATFTRPSFANFIIIAVGWIQTYGAHAVTQTLVVTDVAGKRHHEAFHRFFSRGTWRPDDLGRRLFVRLERWTGTGALRICIDDTLAPKKGPQVFGIGSHIDAVRSTKRQKVFCFGHCWVVLAVLVHVPFSKRVWSLPVLFRLYRNKKECVAHDGAYDKKTELARAMIDVFAGWTARRIELAADSAYCNNTVTRGLPGRVVLFGSMRPDAVLSALPRSNLSGARGGRPRKRGDLLPKPEQIAQDASRPWQTCKVFLYRRNMTVRYKTLCAQWYRAWCTRLLRVVIVATDKGAVPIVHRVLLQGSQAVARLRRFLRAQGNGRAAHRPVRRPALHRPGGLVPGGREQQPPGGSARAPMVSSQVRFELRRHPARCPARARRLRRSCSMPQYRQLASTAYAFRKCSARCGCDCRLKGETRV